MIEKPPDGPLSSRALRELSLYSTFMFVFAALLMQFLLTQYTALLLTAYSVSYQYSLFAINFLSESNTKWSAEQIYFVFGTGPLLLSGIGLCLVIITQRNIYAGWRVKLALTWMSFLMVNALPFGLLAGVFFFDGFGMAFHWLINSYLLRGTIALPVMLLLIFFSNTWQLMFLRTAYTKVFLDRGDNQRSFMKNIYFKPWIYGFMILLLFSLPFSNFYWRTFLLIAGFLSLTIFSRIKGNSRKPNIMKSDKRIFKSRFQVVYFILILVLIWVADNFLL